ncbi:MAG: Asp-tRNA(Asn)/Glu-tRNA(Gln) amidotransferase subunit GatC [Armatimonadetes bacterium]|nr:Asp-tRNA(Asn)/Glu-tRNA(Gln) amidotransferase subunit GatC [Armatimonadota bacterium]
MPITLDEVQHVAKLARLELTESELLAFQQELNALLGHFQDISDVDLEGIDPKPHAVSLRNVWADDVIELPLDRDMVLKNAPKSRAGLFVVPTIIEE